MGMGELPRCIFHSSCWFPMSLLIGRSVYVYVHRLEELGRVLERVPCVIRLLYGAKCWVRIVRVYAFTVLSPSFVSCCYRAMLEYGLRLSGDEPFKVYARSCCSFGSARLVNGVKLVNSVKFLHSVKFIMCFGYRFLARRFGKVMGIICTYPLKNLVNILSMMYYRIMLNYTIKSLVGFACPARFNGASCSTVCKDIDDINKHIDAKGYTITSEYHRPCDDTYVVLCVSPRGINISYVIPEWSQVIRAYVAFVGFKSRLIQAKVDASGGYVTLTDAGLDAGLYPALSHLADMLTFRGIPSHVSFVCPHYGELTFPYGQFYVNVQ